MYFVYLLKSLKDENYYVGLTSDIEKRIKDHNSGKTRSTKNRRPFIMVYFEKCDSLKKAREREMFLKSYKGVSEKRKIIEQYNRKSEIV